MLKSRIIPTLLIRDKGLVKTLAFKPDKYVGDPINAVRIYNEKQVDELTVLDIDATAQGREPDYRMIENLASECRMPLCYGGGITTPEQAAQIISLGVEKVSLSSAFITRPDIIPAFADRIGAQSVVLTMDIVKVKKLLRTSNQVVTHNATKRHDIDIPAFLNKTEGLGVGEIVINCVDRDGAMQGYDLDLAKIARDATSCPLTMLGGAGSVDHMQALIDQIGTCGAAAGSMFVYRGNYKAVLINYDRPGRL